MLFRKKKILSYVADQFNVDLSDVLLIGCQHILGTTVNLLDELMVKGLKPKNIYLIGKCYSINKSVYEKIKKKRIHISPLSYAYESHISFDEQLVDYIEIFLKEIITEVDLSKYEKIIILDDGGQLICSANQILSDFSKVVGIEQTSSGYEKVESLDLKFPVINVARSELKLEQESPLIAERIIRELIKNLKYYRISNPRILVVGNGFIGNNITRLLANKYEVDSYDLAACNDPFPGTLSSKLKQYDVIMGITGKTILTPEQYGLLGGKTVLVSGSSSDREFSAVHLRKLVKENRNCHLNICSNEIILLNSGFPINFTGDKHSVAPKKIILTRALLLAGVLQSMKLSGKKGIIDLDKKIQNKIRTYH